MRDDEAQKGGTAGRLRASAENLWRNHPGVVGFFALLTVAWLARPSSWAKPLPFDAGQYLYVGQTILDGGMPYVDAVNNKGPLTFLVFAGIDLISASDPVLVRFAITVAIALAAVAAAAYTATFAGRLAGALTGLFVAILSASISLDGDDVNTEQLGIAAVAGAWYLATRSRMRWAFAAGAAVGAAVGLNIVFAAVIPVIIWELWRAARPGERSRRLLVALAGSATVLFPLFLWLVIGGALDDFVDVVFGQAVRVGGRLPGAVDSSLAGTGLLPAGGLWIAAVVAALVAARSPGRLRAPATAAVVWILLVILRIKTTSYEYPHHYVIALPAIAVALAVGVASVWREELPERLALSAIILVLVCWPYALGEQTAALRIPAEQRYGFLHPTSYNDEISATVERWSDPGEEIWTDAPPVYWATDRRSASRYFDSNAALTAEMLRQQGVELRKDPPVVIASLIRAADRPPLQGVLSTNPYRLVYRSGVARVWVLEPER